MLSSLFPEMTCYILVPRHYPSQWKLLSNWPLWTNFRYSVISNRNINFKITNLYCHLHMSSIPPWCAYDMPTASRIYYNTSISYSLFRCYLWSYLKIFTVVARIIPPWQDKLNSILYYVRPHGIIPSWIGCSFVNSTKTPADDKIVTIQEWM